MFFKLSWFGPNKFFGSELRDG